MRSRWRYDPKGYKKLCDEDLIVWKKRPKNGAEDWWPYVKTYLEGRTKRPSPLWDDLDGSKKASRDLRALMDGNVFDHPKPVGLVRRLMQIAPPGEFRPLFLDFFAGSGTLAQAVLESNRDGGDARFILVQLPEPTKVANGDGTYTETGASKAGYATIAEVMKERVRRVITKLQESEGGKLNLTVNKDQDCGFRVFKLAELNFKIWDAEPAKNADAVERRLALHIDHLRDGRTTSDFLYEILLKSGFPLAAPVETLELAGKSVFSAAGGALFICLERELTLDLIRAMAERKPERVVCLDEGFAGNDQLKANAVQTFKTKGIVVSRRSRSAMKLQFDANQTFSLTPSRRSPTCSMASRRVRRNIPSSKQRTIRAVRRTGADRIGGRQSPSACRRQAACQHPAHAGPQRHRDCRPGRRPGGVGTVRYVPPMRPRLCPHFSVEMETGTGKTYVYLRTIFELSRRYGFQKFIIVVPSVAIREGVLKNIEITAEHFRALYNNLPFEHFVYDAKKVNRLRQFAISNTLQILIINIDAFRKNFTGTEDEQKSNVIYKESDKLSGRQPIEFVQAARPIVIIDEPQSVDSAPRRPRKPSGHSIRFARSAIPPRTATRTTWSTGSTRCGPLSFGWSSRSSWPVPPPRAAPTMPSSASSRSTTRRASRPSFAFTCRRPDGPKEKSVTVKNGDDLFSCSNERAAYEQRLLRSPKSTPSRATNSSASTTAGPCGSARKSAECATTCGGRRSSTRSRSTWRRNLQLRSRGMKVLSLFFIDRVANYRDYDASGQPVKGKFAEAFEAALAEFAKDAAYCAAGMAQAADGAAAQRLFCPRQERACSRTRAATPRPTTRSTTSS